MTDDTRREPFKEGDEFLNYRIHSLLGRGGHAFVYSGQHLFMERPVAIKVIPAPAEMNSDVYKRARLEAKILSQLSHPNVVKVYDAGVTEIGVIYIVMEMLEGWTLRAALNGMSRFTVSETLHVGLQVAAAVQAAHEQHAIHRDLKPENVFVLPGNVVKVLDFGITKFLGTNTTMTTEPHLIRGTPQYMSPEHMEGRVVTVRSDIYALGSILYELLATIAPALVGLQEVSSYAIGFSQIHRMPPRLDEVCSDVPRYVARSIQRMLAKDPGERPASMCDVVDELRQLQTRLAIELNATAGVLRELWHAPLDSYSTSVAPRGPSTVALHGTVVLSSQPTVVGGLPRSSPAGSSKPVERSGPAHPAPSAPTQVDSNANMLLVPRKPSGSSPEASALHDRKRVMGLARDAMAQRLAERVTSSAPAPVILQRRQSRVKAHVAPLLLLAVVLGGVIGYGALMSFGRVHWTNHSPSANAAPPVAESFGPTTAAASSPNAVSSVQRILPYAPETASTALDARVNKGKSPLFAVSSSTPSGARAIGSSANQAPPRVTPTNSATVADTNEIPASKDASQHNAYSRPASASRPGKAPKSKDELIFGAEDLSW
jgi:serine/threonine protein kinase